MIVFPLVMKDGISVFGVAPRLSKLPDGPDKLQLMMMLSLNLLVLVFFMLLNSMASYDAADPDAVMSNARKGTPVTDGGDTMGEAVPLAPHAVWREATLTHLRGTILNRIDLRVLPQAANADEVVVELPFDKVFKADGSLLKAGFLYDVRQAADGSFVAWSVESSARDIARVSPAIATLARQGGGDVAWHVGANTVVKAEIRPQTSTKPKMGLDMQSLGARAGGTVKGVAYEQ